MKEAIKLIEKELEKLNFDNCQDSKDVLIMRTKINAYREILDKLKSYKSE